MSRFLANSLLLLAGLLWGGGFIAQETAMEDIGPFLFVALRFSLAAVALIPFAVWEARRSRPDQALSGARVAQLLLVSAVFFISMILQQVGLLATSVTNAGMLTGLYVVMVPLIGALFLGYRQPAIIWVCAAAATGGIWLLGGGGLDRFTWGDATVLGAALFAALHVIALGWAAKISARPVAIALYQFAFGAVLAAGLYFVARAFDWSAEPPFDTVIVMRALPEIFYAGLVAGAAAFTLMAIGQQFTTASDAAILLSSEALFAAFGGALLLGERLDPTGYLGCAILFGAILAVAAISASGEADVT